MKKIFLSIVIFTFLLCFNSYAQNVAINKDGSNPNGSAMLDVSATDAGILIPRMTEAQKSAIATPATGLLVFQTDNTPGFQYYNGTIWVPMISRQSQDVMFEHNGDDFIEADKSVFTTYGYILFRGTATVGAPSKVSFIGYSVGGDAFSMRVRDITNSKNIVTKLNITNTTSAIIDLGTISNLPAGEAIFAIQARKDAGDKGRLQAISILY